MTLGADSCVGRLTQSEQTSEYGAIASKPHSLRLPARSRWPHLPWPFSLLALPPTRRMSQAGPAASHSPFALQTSGRFPVQRFAPAVHASQFEP